MNFPVGLQVEQLEVRAGEGTEFYLSVESFPYCIGFFFEGIAMSPSPAKGVFGAPEVSLLAGSVFERDFPAIGDYCSGEAGVLVRHHGFGFRECSLIKSW